MREKILGRSARRSERELSGIPAKDFPEESAGTGATLGAVAGHRALDPWIHEDVFNERWDVSFFSATEVIVSRSCARVSAT